MLTTTDGGGHSGGKVNRTLAFTGARKCLVNYQSVFTEHCFQSEVLFPRTPKSLFSSVHLLTHQYLLKRSFKVKSTFLR